MGCVGGREKGGGREDQTESWRLYDQSAIKIMMEMIFIYVCAHTYRYKVDWVD